MVRHLFFDIETMANLVWSWDIYKSQNWSAVDVETRWYPMSFGYKWLGDDEVQYCSLEYYKGYRPQIKRYKDGSFKVRPVNFKPLLIDLHKLFSEADIVSGWNSKKFDVARMNMLMIEAGLPPLPDFKNFDVMLEKRKLGFSDKNSLAYTSVQFGVGEKMSNDGWPLWIKCAEGDKDALKEMEEYCKIDVQRTEDIYLYLRPYIKNHPSVGIMDGRPASCDNCGSERLHNHTKKFYAKRGWRMQYKCYDCGAYKLGTTLHKVGASNP